MITIEQANRELQSVTWDDEPTIERVRVHVMPHAAIVLARVRTKISRQLNAQANEYDRLLKAACEAIDRCNANRTDTSTSKRAGS